MKSMLKMQRVAPQIKAIQEEYKKYGLRDPRKAQMNEEISGIYKREGVNPAGGCLPMLIQFPFLIAYYRMLGAAIDLRHAHWLWIKDLSAAEPFPHILPYHHGRQHAAGTEDDAASRHGSHAAEDDDHHDAADDGLHLFPFGRRPEPVLCRIQFDFHRAAGNHEPHIPGQRNA